MDSKTARNIELATIARLKHKYHTLGLSGQQYSMYLRLTRKHNIAI